MLTLLVGLVPPARASMRGVLTVVAQAHRLSLRNVFAMHSDEQKNSLYFDVHQPCGKDMPHPFARTTPSLSHPGHLMCLYSAA